MPRDSQLTSHPLSRRRQLLAAARRAVRVAWAITCVALIAGAAVMAVATARYHLTPLAVGSGSMEPSLPVHSLIFVEEVDPQEVRVGDIITFDPPGTTPRVTHRVVERERRGSRWYFRTKGDANPAPDDWRRGMEHPERYHAGITYGDGPALRYVATIPYAGWITVLASFPRVRVVLFLLPFAAVCVWLLVLIWRPRWARGGATLTREAPRRQALAQRRSA